MQIAPAKGYSLDRLWSFWIDRGGTFTDVIARAGDGQEVSLKLLSASPAYADAAVEAMRRVLGAAPGDPFPAARVQAIKMGTTVATNALLERAGAKTLRVVTEGFADALVIGDQARPDLFALDIARPAPLHACVVEATERFRPEVTVFSPKSASGGEVSFRDKLPTVVGLAAGLVILQRGAGAGRAMSICAWPKTSSRSSACRIASPAASSAWASRNTTRDARGAGWCSFPTRQGRRKARTDETEQKSQNPRHARSRILRRADDPEAARGGRRT